MLFHAWDSPRRSWFGAGPRFFRFEVLNIRSPQNLSSVAAERLPDYAFFAILQRMTDNGRRPRRKGARPKAPSSFKAQSSELGALLADLRTAKGLSLREVEEATGKAVSNAYLSQLENGKIKKPSPNVLHSLAAVYAVPYEALMEKAGYLLPSEGNKGKNRTRLAVFAIDDLTAEEEEELLKYLAFLRSRKPLS
jgi:transcriptional regulator with XRE-family HTH domain